MEHSQWARSGRVTRLKVGLGCAKMATACRDFVVCTVAYIHKPLFRSRLPWWPYLMNISWKLPIGHNTCHHRLLSHASSWACRYSLYFILQASSVPYSPNSIFSPVGQTSLSRSKASRKKIILLTLLINSQMVVEYLQYLAKTTFFFSLPTCERFLAHGTSVFRLVWKTRCWVYHPETTNK